MHPFHVQGLTASEKGPSKRVQAYLFAYKESIYVMSGYGEDREEQNGTKFLSLDNIFEMEMTQDVNQMEWKRRKTTGNSPKIGGFRNIQFYKDSLYVFGRSPANRWKLNLRDFYWDDFKVDKKSSKLISGYASFTSCVLQDKMYAIQEEDSNSQLTIYDFITDAWSVQNLTQLPLATTCHIFSTNNKIWILVWIDSFETDTQGETRLFWLDESFECCELKMKGATVENAPSFSFVVANSHLYLLGGVAIPDGKRRKYLNQLTVIDLVNGYVDVSYPKSMTKKHGIAVGIFQNMICGFGGWDGTERSNQLDIFKIYDNSPFFHRIVKRNVLIDTRFHFP